MIPEDQIITACRITVLAPSDEAGECRRIRHRDIALVVAEALNAALDDLIDLIFRVGKYRVLPSPASAGVDDDLHAVSIEVGFQHFLEVICRHSVV